MFRGRVWRVPSSLHISPFSAAATKKAKKPKKKAAPGKKKKLASKGKRGAFYDSEDDEEETDEDSEDEDEEAEGATGGAVVPEDHALLLRASLALLRSRNSGVVLAVAALHQYIGDGDKATQAKIGKALVRIMRTHREVQFVVLTNIVEFAKQSPDLFRKYLKDFFISVGAWGWVLGAGGWGGLAAAPLHATPARPPLSRPAHPPQEAEPAFVRTMKIDVLAAIASPENVAAILREFTRYVKDDNKTFVRHAIQAIVRIANALPDMADRCMRGLMALVTSDDDAVVAEAVIAIRQLLQQHTQHDGLVVRLAKRLPLLKSPAARSAIVWILGEFQVRTGSESASWRSRALLHPPRGRPRRTSRACPPWPPTRCGSSRRASAARRPRSSTRS